MLFLKSGDCCSLPRSCWAGEKSLHLSFSCVKPECQVLAVIPALPAPWSHLGGLNKPHASLRTQRRWFHWSGCAVWTSNCSHFSRRRCADKPTFKIKKKSLINSICQFFRLSQWPTLSDQECPSQLTRSHCYFPVLLRGSASGEPLQLAPRATLGRGVSLGPGSSQSRKARRKAVVVALTETCHPLTSSAPPGARRGWPVVDLKGKAGKKVPMVSKCCQGPFQEETSHEFSLLSHQENVFNTGSHQPDTREVKF